MRFCPCLRALYLPALQSSRACVFAFDCVSSVSRPCKGIANCCFLTERAGTRVGSITQVNLHVNTCIQMIFWAYINALNCFAVKMCRLETAGLLYSRLCLFRNLPGSLRCYLIWKMSLESLWMNETINLFAGKIMKLFAFPCARLRLVQGAFFLKEGLMKGWVGR